MHLSIPWPAESTVSLQAAPDGRAALLIVQDTGIGIPEAELPHIFDRFHRIEGQRGRTLEGTGIGLALVNELVRLHGGSIAVESQVAAGTAVTVRVPFGRAHLPVDAQGDTPARSAPGRRRRRDLRRGSPALVARLTETPAAPKSWKPPALLSSLGVDPGSGGQDRRASCWPTTTPTCATTSSGCFRPGYDVEAVGDGQEALNSARRGGPT